MFLLTLMYLNMLYGFSVEQTNPSYKECKDVPKENVSILCTNPNCVKHYSIAFFCEYLYADKFKCGSNYFPLRHICDDVQQCLNSIDEDPILCSYITCDKNLYKCDKNKSIDFQNCNGIIGCSNGSNDLQEVGRILIDIKNISCPALSGENHIATCRISYGSIRVIVPCYSYIPPGIEAEISCKPFFYSENTSDYQILKCQDNGTWDKDIMNCDAECGVINDIITSPLILKGFPISPIAWPWYAALFTPSDNKNWTYFCSSSIISSNKVITAAHCVWDMPKEIIKIVSGKKFSNFYVDEPTSQGSDAADIFIHPVYTDSLGNFGSDIAIIKLKRPFSFTEFVSPICMNWTLRNIITDMETNFEAMVAGMGITENGTFSNTLLATTVQIVRSEECLQTEKLELSKYVTIATFCAKGMRDSVVCNGDSGSGLAIQNKATGKWILEGIVSISPKNRRDILCDKKYNTIYTNIGVYVNWIYKYIFEH